MDCKYLPPLMWDFAKKIREFTYDPCSFAFPLKRFFHFFPFFLFHTKEMIGSFPKTFIISNVTQANVFFLFHAKEIIGSFPKAFIISNFTEEKVFPFFFFI